MSFPWSNLQLQYGSHSRTRGHTATDIKRTAYNWPRAHAAAVSVAFIIKCSASALVLRDVSRNDDHCPCAILYDVNIMGRATA